MALMVREGGAPMKVVFVGATILMTLAVLHMTRLSISLVQGAGSVIIVDRWTNTVYACRGGDCTVLYPPKQID